MRRNARQQVRSMRLCLRAVRHRCGWHRGSWRVHWRQRSQRHHRGARSHHHLTRGHSYRQLMARQAILVKNSLRPLTKGLS
jgi:hypothetical protein